MTRPPAVDYPLGKSVLLSGAWWFTWICAMAIDLYWFWSVGPADWRPWLGLLLTVTAALLASRWRPLTQAGTLSWDGTEWWWQQPRDRLQGDLAVRLDTQSGLLVRFVSHAGATHWFWLERASRPEHWLGIRRALIAACPQRGDPAPDQSRQPAPP